MCSITRRAASSMRRRISSTPGSSGYKVIALRRADSHLPARRSFANLPDRAMLRRLAHHLRGVRAMERLLELRHVLHRPVHAERPLCMRVGQSATGLLLGRHVLAPHLGKAEEEALLGREAVDGFPLLAGQRLLVG